MKHEELKMLKDKVKSGDKGSLLKYLQLIHEDSLNKLTVCLPADLKYNQSRCVLSAEILNLLN